MNSYFLLLLIALLSTGVGYLLFRYSSRHPDPTGQASTQLLALVNDLRREIQESTTSQRKEVEGKLDLMHDRMLKNMQDSSSALQKHFQHSFGVFRDVTERLTKLDETNKQVLNFSEQLQSLENILKNPKQRGILGEYWLEALLGQVLPPGQYEMQFQLGVDEQTDRKSVV